MLFKFVIADDAANDATDLQAAMVLPDGWSHAGYTSTSTNRIIFVFKYVGDLDFEPTFYTFEYLAARTMAGFLTVIREPARSYEPFTPTYNPTNWVHPNPASFAAGWFAPSGGIGAAKAATSNSQVSVDGAFPHTVTARERLVYVLAQFQGTPPALHDDPSPLVTILAKEVVDDGVNAITATVFTVEYDDPIAPPGVITVVSDGSSPYIFTSISIEALDPTDATEDNYKGKLMRSMLPSPPWDTSFDSDLGKVLTVIGASDNDIGGSFGDDDFLPDGDAE